MLTAFRVLSKLDVVESISIGRRVAKAVSYTAQCGNISFAQGDVSTIFEVAIFHTKLSSSYGIDVLRSRNTSLTTFPCKSYLVFLFLSIKRNFKCLRVRSSRRDQGVGE